MNRYSAHTALILLSPPQKGNYSGRSRMRVNVAHLAWRRVAQRYWAYGRGEKCTAPCLQGVSTDELGHFNGEKCTAPCLVLVQTFYTSFIIRRGPVLLYSHLASKVRYISFQRNLQLKIHLSSYSKSKKCGFENKYLLSFSRSSSAKKQPILRKKSANSKKKSQ